MRKKTVKSAVLFCAFGTYEPRSFVLHVDEIDTCILSVSSRLKTHLKFGTSIWIELFGES